MKRYETYKESGVEWIGEIPENWLVSEYKFVSEVQNGFAFKSAMFDKNIGFPILRIRDITSGEISTFYKGDYTDDYIVQKGDLLIGMDGDFNIRWWDKENVLLNQRCCRIIENEKSVKRFLYYSLPFNLQIINDLTYFTTVKHLSSGDINNAKFPLPSPQEQTQIANYLDYKTGLIDAIIAQKEELIKKLKEQRQAIINEAVTKGLNPNVKLKDSGIEWLGEIPEHWEVKKLKYLGIFQNGVSAGADYFGSGFPFLSYGDVYNNKTLPTKIKGLANSSIADRERFSVEKDDVFFTRTSETVDEIGITSICKSTIENAVFAGFLIRFRPFKDLVFSELYNYYLRSFIPRFFFVKEMNLVTRASLSQELLKRLPILIPPMDEQVSTSIHLKDKINNINTVIDVSTNSIKKLKEYRQSLISEAVTGKIDVRDWQAPKS